jgi:integrase
MACVYRQKRPGGGFYREWRFKYKDAAGAWKYGIGWIDKQKTKDHASSVESEARAIRKGEKSSPPSWLKNRNKPIKEIIEAYMAWGRACGGKGGRPWQRQNGRLKETCLTWWVEQLGLTVLADIDLARVEKELRVLSEKLAPKTVYLRFEALRSLCQWSIKRGFLGESPLRGLAALDVRAKTPHRALTEEETAQLLRVAPADRRVWYETALETGYRIGELTALRVRNLDQFGPSLPLGADYTKNRKDARQPITRELADKLLKLVEGKQPEEPMLGIPTSYGYKRLKTDLNAADIPLLTEEGKATWHSLRKVYVNNLIRTGADVKTVMELARHSAATMSMDVYASAKPALLRAAVESAAQHIRRTVEAEPCCTGVASAKAVNGSDSDNGSDDPDLQDLKVVRATGVEPARPCGHQPLKLVKSMISSMKSDLRRTLLLGIPL